MSSYPNVILKRLQAEGVFAVSEQPMALDDLTVASDGLWATPLLALALAWPVVAAIPALMQLRQRYQGDMLLGVVGNYSPTESQHLAAAGAQFGVGVPSGAGLAVANTGVTVGPYPPADLPHLRAQSYWAVGVVGLVDAYCHDQAALITLARIYRKNWHIA